MNRHTCTICFLVVTLAGLGACSSPSSKETGKPKRALETIRGKAQIVLTENSATDAALSAGGQSVYLFDGLHRYRLFLRTPADVKGGKEYIAEGFNAQKIIDEIGDPDQGKNGYPLESSCARVVKTAWPGLAFDVTDGQTSVLRMRVQRYPARPVFLVVKLTAVDEEGKDKKVSATDEDAPEITVLAEKQRALLISGPTVQTAPLWQPAGGTVSCKLIIGTDGKIAELETGKQLCEAVPWTDFSYKPTLQRGHPVKVETEVEVRFEPRK